MSKFPFLVLAAVLLAQNGFAFPSIGDIQEYANFANDALGVLRGDLPPEAILLGSTGPTLDKILASVEDIGQALALFTGSKPDSGVDQWVNGIVSELKLEGRLRPALRELHTYIVRVDSLYERFLYYSKDRERFNDYTIEKFITSITSNADNDLPDVLDKLYALAKPSQYGESVINLIAEEVQGESPEARCNTGLSAQTRLFQLYDTFSVLESRAFLMTSFAYSILTLLKKSPFFQEMEIAKDRLVSRTNEYLIGVQTLMKGLPRDIALCDAKKYKEGVNYAKLGRLFYIEEPARHSMPGHPVESDIQDNKVITGVRWIYQDAMLQIQIKQGILASQGRVVDDSEEWKPLPEYESDTNNFYLVKENSERELLTFHKDYFVFTMVTKMDMDDILLPKNYVVTAIGFNYYRNSFTMKIRGTLYDYNSGKLILDNEKSNIWQTPDTMTKDINGRSEEYDHARKDKGRDWLKHPEDSPMNVVDSVPNTAILITPAYGTSHEDLFGDYSPVPFFDTRPVTAIPNIALGGIGLFHRGSPEYGGYFNFRVFNVDASEFIVSTENEDDLYAK